MNKQERIDFRVDAAVKSMFTEAAQTYGMNLSTFMIAAAQEQVARAQRHRQAIILNDKDRDLFMSALERQEERPMPNAFAKAMANHDRLIIE
jgi:uncharacterized protein (DUF1778 family)